MPYALIYTFRFSKQGGVISPRWITKMRGRLIPVGDLPAWIGCPNNLELWIFVQGFNLQASNDPGIVKNLKVVR